MKTPREKYINDPKYKAMVDLFESYLNRADFTPSEIREMVILACINYEYHQLHRFRYPLELEDALNKIHEWGNEQKKKEESE